MKYLSKIIYALFIIFISTLLYKNSFSKQIQTFYETEANYSFENNDFNHYLNTFFTATNITDEYSVYPIYEGVADQLFKFKILQSKSLDTIVNWFYFEDNIDDYNIFLNNDQEKYLKMPFTRLSYKIEVKMAGEENLIVNYFAINPTHKYLRQPLPLMQYHQNENGELVYYYSTSDKNGKTFYNQSTTIENIKISFILDNKNLSETIQKDIIVLSNQLNDILDSESLTLNNGIYYSNHFSGNIDIHKTINDFSSANNNNIHLINYDVLKPYLKIRIIYLIKSFSFILFITYLIFGLVPTIDYFKKKYKDKNNIIIEDKDNKTNKRIFHD